MLQSHQGVGVGGGKMVWTENLHLSFKEIYRWVEGEPECNFKRSAIGPREIQCPGWRLGWCDPILWYGGSAVDKDTLILFSFAS